MVILMIREDETLVGRELEIFAHGISKGVRFAESQLQNKVAAENDDKDRFKKTLSEEYRSGYDEGYIDCSIKWSDLMSSSMRDLDEYECGHIDGLPITSERTKEAIMKVLKMALTTG